MSAPTAGLATAVTRQKYFNNALLKSLPIVGVQEGDAVVVIKEEMKPTEESAATSSSPAASTDPADPLAQIDLRSFRVSSSFLCTTCRVAFEASEELRTHSKTAWHVHNLRAKASSKDDAAAAAAAAQAYDTADALLADDPHRVLSEEEFDRLQASEAAAKAAQAGQEDSASSGVSSGGEDAEESRDTIDDEPVVGSSRLSFYTPTQKLTVWKQALVHSSSPPSHLPLHLKSFGYVTALRALPSAEQVCVLMVSGGRFSGGIFRRDVLLAHKNFQRYTTRRKQGGSQSAHDNAKGKANSIGSSIRRKETVRFQEETERILTEWKDLLVGCGLIFIFAPAANRQLLMRTLDKTDTRIRNVPFPTYRPTLEEVKRIHATLTTVEFEDRVNAPFDLENRAALARGQGTHAKTTAAAASSSSAAAAAASVAAAAASAAPTPVDALTMLPEPVTDDLMLNAVREGQLATLQQLAHAEYTRPFGPESTRYRPLLFEAIVAGGVTSTDPVLQSQRDQIVTWLLAGGAGVLTADPNEQTLDAEDARHIICWSALHKASQIGYEFGLEALLRAGADPTKRDSRQRLPLPLVSNAAVRLAIRRLAGTPDMLTRWDWSAAEWHPLTSEGEAAADEAKRQKAKEKKAKAKERAKATKAREEQQAATLAAKAEEDMRQAQQAKALRESAQVVAAASSARAQVMSGLTDREKRALAAERRLCASTGAGPKCTLCANPLTRTPFERLEYKYCTIACLQQHKAELDLKTAPAAGRSTTYNPK